MQLREITSAGTDELNLARPHFTANDYVKSLTEWYSFAHDDAMAVTDLTERVKMCPTTLQQPNYQSASSSCLVVGQSVSRMPTLRQSTWFEVAALTLRHEREPSLVDLTRSIDEKRVLSTTGLFVSFLHIQTVTVSEMLGLLRPNPSLVSTEFII
ncbi:hypothetical protein P879_09456 [Paragonimus westermani]|uniref:Uncharacterized protein n=1 Tax=Paragonimus westermani TaxID=34504 RepID=A0A8T0DU73_9TREM|nr:hypothetical protein P879_09456 [Paragonimus westermani]